MKVSEAILLGSLQMRSVPYTRWDRNGGGCALGMAETAMGLRQSEFDHYPLERKFPWLWNKPLVMPCRCHNPFPVLGSWIIAHLFNEHVHDRQDWTLERLVDWVRDHEPAEIEEILGLDEFTKRVEELQSV